MPFAEPFALFSSGGPGEDFIYGGIGPDAFRFLKTSDVDLIKDFEPAI